MGNTNRNDVDPIENQSKTAGQEVLKVGIIVELSPWAFYK